MKKYLLFIMLLIFQENLGITFVNYSKYNINITFFSEIDGDITFELENSKTLTVSSSLKRYFKKTIDEIVLSTETDYFVIQIQNAITKQDTEEDDISDSLTIKTNSPTITFNDNNLNIYMSDNSNKILSTWSLFSEEDEIETPTVVEEPKVEPIDDKEETQDIGKKIPKLNNDSQHKSLNEENTVTHNPRDAHDPLNHFYNKTLFSFYVAVGALVLYNSLYK